MADRRLCFCLLVAITSPAFLCAADQPTPTTRDEIVVTASRIEEAQPATPTSADVFDAVRLEQRSGGGLVEALRYLPGIEALQSGGPGRVTSIQLRGANSAHTLVLLDGQRLNDPTTGAFDFADLRVDEVERIEVVRGPQSALWGSEALGGVIQVVSRPTAPGRQGRLRLGGGEGSLRLAGLSIGYGGPNGGARAGIDGERGALLSTASDAAGNSEVDEHQVAQLSLRGDRGFGASTRLTTSARAIDSTVDLDGFDFGVGPVDDPNYIQDRRLAALSASLEHQGNRLLTTLRLSSSDERLRGEDPDSPFNPYAIDSRTKALDAQGDLDWRAGLLSFGTSLERRSGTNPGAFDTDLDLLGVFAQQRVELGGCTISVGGRVDDHETFGGATTARLASACPLGPVVVRGSWGTAFRAPALNELAFPFFGNPDLEPERVTSAELGVGWRRGAFDLDTVVFRQRFEDLIGVGPEFTAVNIAAASIDGAEVRLRGRLRWLAFDLAQTFLDAEDNATGASLVRRARHRTSLFLEATLGNHWAVTAGVIAVGRRSDVGGVTLEPYERVDVALRGPLHPRVDLEVRIGNILDQAYEEIAGYGTTGRLGRVAATWSF